MSAPRLVRTLLLVVALVTASAAFADEAPIPAPVGYVNDTAGLMDEAARAKLESFLVQVQKKTGAYFAVLTVPTTAPDDPRAYKTRVYHEWKLANQEPYEGLLMLVAVKERRVEFETGYGLEGTLTDGFESSVVRERMAPRFRDGDYESGITQGVLACAQRIAKAKGVTLEWNGSEPRYRTRSPKLPRLVVALVLFLLIAILVIGVSAQRYATASGMPLGGPYLGRRRRRRSGWYDGGWGGGWGGGFGGGGFGGGGGGGGGSFGGFGGGGGFGSGGGGGGGSW